MKFLKKKTGHDQQPRVFREGPPDRSRKVTEHSAAFAADWKTQQIFWMVANRLFLMGGWGGGEGLSNLLCLADLFLELAGEEKRGKATQL